MSKHFIENMIIISVYDSGCGFRVMIDGSILSSTDTRHNEFYKAFSWIPNYNTIYDFQKKYNRDILLCEDGDIQFYPIKK